MNTTKIFSTLVVLHFIFLLSAETSFAFINIVPPTNTLLSSSYHSKLTTASHTNLFPFSSSLPSTDKYESFNDHSRQLTFNKFSQQVTTNYILPSSIIFWCIQVCLDPGNIISIPGAIFAQFSLLALLWIEVYRRMVMKERWPSLSSLNLVSMRNELEDHRAEKSSMLRSQLCPAFLISSIASAIVLLQKQPGKSIKNLLSFGAPSMTALVLFSSCWMALQTLDSCLDECAPAKPTVTVTCAAALVFSMMARLTFLHTFFTIMAARILIQCIMGKTADKPLWIGLAIPFIGGLYVAANKNWLPALPLGVAAPVTNIYFGFNVICGYAHEKLQSSCPQKVKWVWLFKSLGDLALVAAGLPVSWLIIDSLSIMYYWATQVITDTVALKALGY